ncbi:MAG TPA: hypothetical protein VNC50_09075 [Planctomycetia bacterium]|nr:hypothetical protein [Planctomycetia bacterium]
MNVARAQASHRSHAEESADGSEWVVRQRRKVAAPVFGSDRWQCDSSLSYGFVDQQQGRFIGGEKPLG